MYDFDDIYTAPVHGFSSAMEYWQKCSAKQYLPGVRVPLLLLNAKNDPFLPAWVLPTAAEMSSSVVGEFPEEGGHVGFPEGPKFAGDLWYLPRRVMTFSVPAAEPPATGADLLQLKDAPAFPVGRRPRRSEKVALNLNFPQGRIGRLGFISLVLFILTIPLGNWVTNVGLVCDPHGPCLIPVWPGVWSPSAVMVAGLALVLRDAVQSILGNLWAVAAIAAGALLSLSAGRPGCGARFHSGLPFSELADFAVYTPMRRRFPSSAVVVSGLVGSVVDSMIFLSLAFGSLDYLLDRCLASSG